MNDLCVYTKLTLELGVGFLVQFLPIHNLFEYIIQDMAGRFALFLLEFGAYSQNVAGFSNKVFYIIFSTYFMLKKKAA